MCHTRGRAKPKSDSSVTVISHGRGMISGALANHLTSRSVRAQGNFRRVLEHPSERPGRCWNACPALLYFAGIVLFAPDLLDCQDENE